VKANESAVAVQSLTYGPVRVNSLRPFPRSPGLRRCVSRYLQGTPHHPAPRSSVICRDVHWQTIGKPSRAATPDTVPRVGYGTRRPRTFVPDNIASRFGCPAPPRTDGRLARCATRLALTTVV
jgi:hypothetical protein